MTGPAAGRREATRGVVMFTVSLVALAVGVTALAWPRGAWIGDVSWPTVAAVAMLMTVAGSLLIRFQYREQVMALDLFEAVLAAAIVAFPVPLVVALAVVAQVVAEVINRNAPLKAIFNIAQWMLAAALGATAFHLLATSPRLDASTVGALITSMAVIAVTNMAAISIVMRLAQGGSVGAILRTLAPNIILTWAVNTAFGVLLVVALDWSVAGLALSLVPLGLLHAAYRGYATATADKARLEGLHRASKTLASTIDPRDAIPRFLAAVHDCFHAEVVELVLLEGGGRIVHRLDGAPDGYGVRIETHDIRSLAAELARRQEPLRLTASHPDLALAGLLRRERWRDCLAAPLVADGAPIGVLCAYNRTGLQGYEDGELRVLQAIAGDAAAMIRKGALLDEVFEERRKLAEIVTLASDGITTIGPDGTILTWNPELERITGYRSDEMVGTRFLIGLHPQDADGRPVSLERWALSDALPSAHLRVLTRSGEVRWLSCSYTPVRDAEDTPRVLIVLARDVTKERELEQMKDDFVATVSHELRTPLTPIKGWATTLLDNGERLGPEQRQAAAASIMRQAETLERLITNLLEVAQIERGTNVRRDGIVAIEAVVQRVLQDCRNSHPDALLRVTMPPRPVRARGDDLWVERILSNLLSNALKYAPSPEGVDVHVLDQAGQVVIEVTDHGPGIPESEQRRIFERFQRLGDHMTRSTGGAGLGLYIARQLARSIGGRLTVRSTPGHGATFALTLEPATRLQAIG